MSRIFDFNKRFGKTVDPEEVKHDFVNKITHYLIEPLDEKAGLRYGEYSNSTEIFNFVAMEFNQNPTNIIYLHNRNHFYSDDIYRPSFKIFSDGVFEKTLILVEIFYDYLSTHSIPGTGEKQWSENINKIVAYALNQPVSLGISWRDGKFYPEGAEEFDEKLISDVLKWLEQKPKIQALYKNALDQYSQSLSDNIKRKDVMSNAFQAVEQLTQEYLKSPKPSFDNNFNSLVDKLVIDKEWKKIFNSYKELSKEFGRHAGSGDSFIPTQEDTEAFLYLSGLIMRLILEKV
ncbi:MAG: hypothetical protein WCV83_01210 [Candidatus Magasanikbacteria bacterium]